MKPLKTTITDGQSYVDEPVYAHPAKRLLTPIADGVAERCGHVRYIPNANGTVRRERTDIKNLLLAYNHVRLKWMRPDGKGGLVPR